ncbi:hypothetical protein BGZ83_000929 [Gryganskiella cystojenkinii]|nr:hypothetical protein BGZ83_000929 [Gryganskiella cystojenkinii]
MLMQTAGEIRQAYLQQYLKQFLRKVHPDLFQHHPKEQLQNSNSLQDLLPLVNSIKDSHSTTLLNTRHPKSIKDPEEPSARFLFYYRGNTKPAPTSPADSTPSTSSTSTSTELAAVEHSLPLINTRIAHDSNETRADAQAEALDRELKSWQMVQSFLGLCEKVGVTIKGSDKEEVDRHVEESKKIATKNFTQNRTPQKPLREIFQEELQNSFSGSDGHVGAEHVDRDAVSHARLGKIGGSAPVLDAQVMIRSNPLLFKSPDLSKSKLSKLVRTWIHWQEEDMEVTERSPFTLQQWWRKVPVMVLASADERSKLLKAAAQNQNGPSTKGMLVVHQGMSKLEMIDYLEAHLDSVEANYKDLLRAATSSEKA